MDELNYNHRKISHLRGAWEYWRNPPNNSFDLVQFIHNALPEIDFDDLSLKVKFLNHMFSYPLFITAMTGGHPEVREINRILGYIATHYNIPVEVGSQRAALERPELVDTFTAIREGGSKAFVIGNIGLAQIRDSPDPIQMIQNCVDMIQANGISIHLNVMQELLQPEGNHRFSGVLGKIGKIVEHSPVPVIIKEVGCGISGPVAAKLEKAGVRCINVAGYGGTNFNDIELNRNLNIQGTPEAQQTPESTKMAPPWTDLIHWGIPTVVALKWVRAVTALNLIGSGGIRSGVDLAKALCLGASVGGICGALLPALYSNGHFPANNADVEHAIERVKAFLDQFLLQFKITLTGIGCSSVEHLHQIPLIYFGQVREYLENLNLLTNTQ